MNRTLLSTFLPLSLALAPFALVPQNGDDPEGVPCQPKRISTEDFPGDTWPCSFGTVFAKKEKAGDCKKAWPSCRFDDVVAKVGGCNDEAKYMALETEGRRLRPNGRITYLHYDFDPITPGCGGVQTLVLTVYSRDRTPMARKWVSFECSPCSDAR